MARLEGKWAKGKSWLGIRPVPLGDGRDAVTYEVQFCPGTGNEPGSRVFSVADWQSQHTPVWLLARTFVEVNAVVGARVAADLWSGGRSEPAALYRSVDSLVVVLFGNPKQNRVAVRFFIQEGEDPDVFRSVFVNATVDAAQEFGACLEREIADACPKWWAEHCALRSGKAG